MTLATPWLSRRFWLGVLLVDLSVDHPRSSPSLRRDRDRQVVPAVPRVQEAVVVVLVDAGEEDEQPPPDVGLDQGEHLGDPGEAEEGRHARDRHDRVVGLVERLHVLDDPPGDRLLELGERSVVEQFRATRSSSRRSRRCRAAEPVGEGVGQVARGASGARSPGSPPRTCRSAAGASARPPCRRRRPRPAADRRRCRSQGSPQTRW